MFQYMLVFLLLNCSYRSLGGPVPTNGPVTIANLLTTLAKSCENKFLSDQIENRSSYCAEITSPHQGKQLECLLFYDINSQLCTAISLSRLVLATADYSDKINEEQDVTQLCETTKDWVFSNLTEFTHYKRSVKKVFEHPAMCGKVCGVEDLMSDDANFFCKYFKWGNDMLKRQVSVPQENAAELPSEAGKIDVKTASNDIDVQIKNKISTSTTLNLESVSDKNEGSSLSKTELVRDGASETQQEAEPSNANSAPSEKSENKTSNKVEEPLAVAGEQIVASDPNNQEDKPVEITSAELKSNDQKPESPDTMLTKPDAGPLLKSDDDKEIQLPSHDLDLKESVIETPGQTKDKQPSDTDPDYPDSEESKDGLGDTQGEDDSDDAMIGDINKINKLEDPKEEDKETQSLKTVVSDITGESRLFPSFGQDDDDDDDNDHFFSFFLTAVIMVVLIYVLYHNKNKVGKVFFGLVLEGRQSGRRRNSRGHAYRRLDTLEQAMSTNTTAPPSKIIY